MEPMNDRYSRHILLAEIGEQGQRRLGQSRVLVVGCGALGSNIADKLARAGVGTIKIVDRDVVEFSNLQRQVLFEEDDARLNIPKAEAAAFRLRKINSTINIEPLVTDLNFRNIEDIIHDASIILDGTDNFETRYLLNDACVKLGKTWIYGGVVGSNGMVMSILPGAGPCLRCILPVPPPSGSLPTCDTVGVLNTAPAIIASLQVTEAYKFLVQSQSLSKSLLHMDFWTNHYQAINVKQAPDCRCCVQKSFDFLESREIAWVTNLCGRNAVQIRPAGEIKLSMDSLKENLEKVGEVSYNGLLLTFKSQGYEMIIFPDARAIIKGTTDQSVAKSLYSKYIGS